MASEGASLMCIQGKFQEVAYAKTLKGYTSAYVSRREGITQDEVRNE